MINGFINDLVNITMEKYRLMYAIYEITKNQKNDISNSDEDALLENIEKKQKQIDEINELDKRFFLIVEAVKEKLDISTLEDLDIVKYPAIKELQIEVSKIMSLLDSISSIERQNDKNLKIEIEKVKEDMKSLQQNKKAYTTYNKYNHAQGVFVDHKK